MAAAEKSSNPKNRSRVQARHMARQKALQALYQRELSGTYLIDIERQFLETQQMQNVDIEYFRALLHGVPETLDQIDALILTALDGRSIEELDPIELTVCRLGTWELRERHDIPMKVIINESVELTKKFGADQGHKFVNGVMDKIAASVRALELRAISPR